MPKQGKQGGSRSSNTVKGSPAPNSKVSGSKSGKGK